MKNLFSILLIILLSTLSIEDSFTKNRLHEFTVDTRAMTSFISKESEQTDKVPAYKSSHITAFYGKWRESDSLRMNIGCLDMDWTNEDILKDSFAPPLTLTKANRFFIPKYNDKRLYEYTTGNYKFYFRSIESNCGQAVVENNNVNFNLTVVDVNEHSKMILFDLCEEELLINRYKDNIIKTITSVRFASSENAPATSGKSCGNPGSCP